MRISLCMIVRDEEEVLGRCLESAREAVDEIVLVDTGSVDRTKEIGKNYTDRIYDYSWNEDFSSARNFALSMGKMEYLMWLDADDVLSRGAADRLKEFKQKGLSEWDLVMTPYETAFDEKGRCTFRYYRERIFKNNGVYRFYGRVHEAVPIMGKVGYEEIPVEHRKKQEGISRRNLEIYETMEKEGEVFDERSLYYYGRELLRHERYEKSEQILEEFLGRDGGWVENKIDGARQLARCRYRLGKEEEALEALFLAMKYDVPRGEVCCDLGRHFLDRGCEEQAAYWFRQALEAPKKRESGAFIEEECYGYLPAILLAVCYDRLGEPEKGAVYNELAGFFKPESREYQFNRSYFASVLGRNAEAGREA